ncbi:UDP-N-acetylglucosamine 1-carboxyvinyltransferase [Patescibacteria group bacterium]
MKKGEKFVIQGLAGRRKLNGTIQVNGAKNAVLKALAATILFKDKVTLKNVPDIEDVSRTLDLLEDLGVGVERNGMSISCDPRSINKNTLNKKISQQLRASIVLTGPVLARTGRVVFPHPGGCVIGARPIDSFVEAFKKMGASVKRKNGSYVIEAGGGKLKGAEIFFKNQSVTGTETFMMAAVLARGKTVLKNAALEPEIKHLADFLNSCGARISGAGTPTIEIQGGSLLSSGKKVYTTPPDRIEAGTFLILGALCAKHLEITHCDPTHLESLITTLEESGINIDTKKSSIVVECTGVKKCNMRSFDIKTHEYPGFPTDLQAPMTVYLTQAHGEGSVFETIFENRLGYTEELSRMGADMTLMDTHRVLVRGPRSLRGREMESPDLRAGLAFVIAAITAKGESVIHNVYNIDRGYENIEDRLRKIGVSIVRN